MNQDDQTQSDAEALLLTKERHQKWLRDAGRFHTKNLFGLWFLLVLALCVVIFAILVREEFSVLIPISISLLVLVVITGAYAFQEAARVHKRIDAILKLLETKDGK